MNSWFKLEVMLPDRPIGPGIDDVGTIFDITDNVDGRVTLEETADLLDRLTFTLKRTETTSIFRFMDQFAEGLMVRLWFGPMDGTRRINRDTEMFVGYLASFRPGFPDSGHPNLFVTAYDPSWLLSKHSPVAPVSYPSATEGDTTYEDIVKLVMKRYAGRLDMQRIEIPSDYAKVKVSAKAPIVQSQDESDWKFLKRLAHGDEDSAKDKAFPGLDCIVYVDIIDGVPKLFFVPEAEKMKDVSPLRFVYPLYGSEIPMSINPLASDGDYLIESANVDDNPDDKAVPTVSVPADAFKDVLSEEEIQSVDQNGGVQLTTEEYFDSFEIDYKAIERDEKAHKITWGARAFASGEVGWEQVKQYVKLKIVHIPAGMRSPSTDVPLTKEQLEDPVKRTNAILKKAGKKRKKRKDAGMHLTLEIAHGNYHVRPRKVYDIVGLGGKYSSSDKRKWFADVVTHVVGTNYKQTIKLTQ